MIISPKQNERREKLIFWQIRHNYLEKANDADITDHVWIYVNCMEWKASLHCSQQNRLFHVRCKQRWINYYMFCISLWVLHQNRLQPHGIRLKSFCVCSQRICNRNTKILQLNFSCAIRKKLDQWSLQPWNVVWICPLISNFICTNIICCKERRKL